MHRRRADSNDEVQQTKSSKKQINAATHTHTCREA